MVLCWLWSHIWRPWFMANNGDILVYFGQKCHYFGFEDSVGWSISETPSRSSLATPPDLQKARRLATSRPSRGLCFVYFFVRRPLHFRNSDVSALVVSLGDVCNRYIQYLNKVPITAIIVHIWMGAKQFIYYLFIIYLLFIFNLFIIYLLFTNAIAPFRIGTNSHHQCAMASRWLFYYF